MQLSEARINANRKNAERSTGPRTSAGKERSRSNAVKHGLCAKVVVTEDAEAVLARSAEIAQTLTSVGGLDGWAAGQVATNSLRIERCQAMEQEIHLRIITRAEVTWDDDRRLEAIILGGTIEKRPQEVSARLRETFHGCEWLLGCWSQLARVADVQGKWTLEQTRMAFDLLGTPLQFREGSFPGASIDPQGRPIASAADPASLARLQIALLLERKELLRPLNEDARQRAQAGLSDDTDPELRRLRRYEAGLVRRLQWSLALLQDLSPPEPEPEPEPEQQPEPEEVAEDGGSPVENRTKPSFDPIGESGVPSRAEKKLMKAESRRDANQRKLEKRRA